ncbi:MAG: hypothetical protein VYB34_16865, partial [Planctomycetota bacterium]|nr:hypothetical protein [Planctomycetota bacterium]
MWFSVPTSVEPLVQPKKRTSRDCTRKNLPRQRLDGGRPAEGILGTLLHRPGLDPDEVLIR